MNYKELMSKIFGFNASTYYVWKKEKRPIISFIDQFNISELEKIANNEYIEILRDRDELEIILFKNYIQYVKNLSEDFDVLMQEIEENPDGTIFDELYKIPIFSFFKTFDTVFNTDKYLEEELTIKIFCYELGLNLFKEGTLLINGSERIYYSKDLFPNENILDNIDYLGKKGNFEMIYYNLNFNTENYIHLYYEMLYKLIVKLQNNSKLTELEKWKEYFLQMKRFEKTDYSSQIKNFDNLKEFYNTLK